MSVNSYVALLVISTMLADELADVRKTRKICDDQSTQSWQHQLACWHATGKAAIALAGFAAVQFGSFEMTLFEKGFSSFALACMFTTSLWRAGAYRLARKLAQVREVQDS